MGVTASVAVQLGAVPAKAMKAESEEDCLLHPGEALRLFQLSIHK